VSARLRLLRLLPSLRARAWSLVIALVTLALLPLGWDGVPERDEASEVAAGYETGSADSEAPCEHEAIPEPRSRSVHRSPVPAFEAGTVSRAPVAARPAAAPRLARPYIPHPSRFTERRLI